MPKLPENTWKIELKEFNAGFSPLAFYNSLTETGGGGHASVMTNCDVLGENLTQGPGLTSLTNTVPELVNFIQDKAVATNVAYGIGTTKLHKFSATANITGGSPSWPQAISNCTSGCSVIDLNGNLYAFYNKASGGDIAKMPLSTETIDPDWGSTVPSGAAALQSANHPVAVKEDIMLFGNGQYVGVYFDGSTINMTRLDFKAGNSVDDILFNAGQWYIAVNSGVTGTNRTQGQIYTYDGAALTAQLSDETAVGMQRIGFLYRLNGIIYVAYQDLSSTGFIIGYIAGAQIKPLARFTGTLPNYQQKTLYKNTILFLSANLIYSAGALVDSLPFQLSQHASTTYLTVGAIAAPFGTPLVSSTDNTTYIVAKFSGYTVDSTWKSIVFPLVSGLNLGYIDSVTVLTSALGTGASCSLTIEANQAVNTSTAQTINTTGRTRHFFRNLGLGAIQDFRVALSWSGGSTTNPVQIRKIIIMGHFVEK